MPVIMRNFSWIAILALVFSTSSVNAAVNPVNINLGNGESVNLYNGSYALVIGVSDYDSTWPDLPGVSSDIESVETALKSKGFVVESVKNPDSSQLSSAFEDFIAKYGGNYENRLLFYFAGHGYTMKPKYGGQSLGFIVPKDAPIPQESPNEFKRFALSMQRIEEYALNIDAKHALFMFDSCFSGSIFSITRALPESISYKTAKPVRVFITSGSENERVPDTSIFRQQFISALDGEGDLNKDGYLTGSELSSFLQDTVVNYSKNAQHPQYGKIRNPNLDKGDIVFVMNNQNTVAINSKQLVPPQQNKTRGIEISDTISKEKPDSITYDPYANWGLPEGVATDGEEEAWSLIKTTGNKDDLKAFVKYFPTGMYASNAIQAIKDIEAGKKSRALPACYPDVCNSRCLRLNKPSYCYASKIKPLGTYTNYQDNWPTCVPGTLSIRCKGPKYTAKPLQTYKPISTSTNNFKMPMLINSGPINFSGFKYKTIKPVKKNRTPVRPTINFSFPKIGLNTIDPSKFGYTKPYAPQYPRNPFSKGVLGRYGNQGILSRGLNDNYHPKHQSFYAQQSFTTSRYNIGNSYSTFTSGQYRSSALNNSGASITSIEKETWEKIKRSKSPADYELFLTTFPKGQFAFAARLTLTKIIDDIWSDIKKITDKTVGSKPVVTKSNKLSVSKMDSAFSELMIETKNEFDKFKRSGSINKDDINSQDIRKLNPGATVLVRLLEQVSTYNEIKGDHLIKMSSDISDYDAFSNEIESGYKHHMVLSDLIYLLNSYRNTLKANGEDAVQKWSLKSEYYNNKINLTTLSKNTQTRSLTDNYFKDIIKYLKMDEAKKYNVN